MRESYLKYYDNVSAFAPMRLSWDAVFVVNKTRRLSALNRLNDYHRLTSSPDLLRLHGELNRNLYEATRLFDGYDYGEGYFYQGLNEIGVTGLRDTDARIGAMALRDRLRGLDVLEIGCNTGFLANAIADVARSVTCFDINPHLVDIAKSTARHLGRSNISASTAAFEDFDTSKRFDAVLSFANHSTYDGKTRQTVEEYLLRCLKLLRPGGLFLFESHSPDYEREGLLAVSNLILTLFKVDQSSVLNYGTFLDSGRTFIVGRR